MGSGKSTLGRALATALNWPFVDLDDEIERAAGMSINALFDDRGEEGFRGLEQDLLRSWSEKSGYVVATGGGTPVQSANRAIMRRSGVTVYLETPLAAIVERLGSAPDDRPLLEGRKGTKLAQFVTDHFARREAYYLESDISYPTEKGVDGLVRLLRDYSM